MYLTSNNLDAKWATIWLADLTFIRNKKKSGMDAQVYISICNESVPAKGKN